MSINNYPFYKDSGVEWLGDVPEHWGVKRLKEVLDEVLYGISEKTKEMGKYEVLGMGDREHPNYAISISTQAIALLR